MAGSPRTGCSWAKAVPARRRRRPRAQQLLAREQEQAGAAQRLDLAGEARLGEERRLPVGHDIGQGRHPSLQQARHVRPDPLVRPLRFRRQGHSTAVVGSPRSRGHFRARRRNLTTTIPPLSRRGAGSRALSGGADDARRAALARNPGGRACEVRAIGAPPRWRPTWRVSAAAGRGCRLPGPGVCTAPFSRPARDNRRIAARQPSRHTANGRAWSGAAVARPYARW